MSPTPSQNTPLKIALWQTSPCGDVQACLAQLETTIAVAAAADADVFVTPEMFIGGYNIGPARIHAHAAEFDEIRRALCRLAAQHKIALVIGVAIPATPLPYNGCIAIDANGVECARYHKTHLFGDTDRGQFTAGEGLSPVFELAGWRIGLAICYDIEFPEVARDLALRGADLIVTPTANMEPFDTVATRLVAARAEENAVYVAYCNYVGAEGEFSYNGLSCVCGPDGQDQARADTCATGLFYATLSHTTLEDTRQSQTHLQDRRPDLYGDDR